jgi:hypothetical protein
MALASLSDVTINGLRQRFVVLKNDRKKPGTSQPDYVLLSVDAPEVDAYRAPAPRTASRRRGLSGRRTCGGSRAIWPKTPGRRGRPTGGAGRRGLRADTDGHHCA